MKKFYQRKKSGKENQGLCLLEIVKLLYINAYLGI